MGDPQKERKRGALLVSVPLASPQFPFWRIYLSKGNLEGMDHLKRDEGAGEGGGGGGVGLRVIQMKF